MGSLCSKHDVEEINETHVIEETCVQQKRVVRFSSDSPCTVEFHADSPVNRVSDDTLILFDIADADNPVL